MLTFSFEDYIKMWISYTSKFYPQEPKNTHLSCFSKIDCNEQGDDTVIVSEQDMITPTQIQ